MKKILAFLAVGFLCITGCKKDDAADEKDTEYPEIVVTANSFPISCSTLTRGQAFTFRATFKDNKALGAYSLDIHHNFDHHNHSTEVNECTFAPVKTPVKPFLHIQNYSIPGGAKEHEATAQITVPADIDPGDYHFMIRLTDQEGWTTIKGLSIKVN